MCLKITFRDVAVRDVRIFMRLPCLVKHGRELEDLPGGIAGFHRTRAVEGTRCVRVVDVAQWGLA
jgi:hypothetical protein